MSKVKIQGNASGTGTLTITAPNTNTDRSLTLPDGAGEILLANGDGSQLTNLPGGGKVLQVVQYDTQVNTTSSATGGVELFNLSITPSSTSSKILALVNVTAQLDGNEYCSFDLYRGTLSSGTKIFNGGEELFNAQNSIRIGYGFSYLDSPSTTSATTYTVVGVVVFSGQTIQFGATGRQSITLMEIAG